MILVARWMWRRAVGIPLTAAALAVPSVELARAQGLPERGAVRGTVRDESGRAVAGALVAVVGGTPAGESDESGSFRVAGLTAGVVRIAVRRIGFAPETLTLTIASRGVTTATLALRRVALPLDTVRVNGRSDVRGPMAGFYARRERGHGRFFTQEQIARRNVSRMSDLLRGIPGLRVDQRRFGVQAFRLRGASQAPLVWLDGMPMGAAEVDLDVFDPHSFAGIEIYSGPATVPAEFTGGRLMSTSGGAIVLWTRQGQTGPPRRKKGEPSPAVLLARMLEQDEIFTVDRVDTPARLLEDKPLLPVYPDSLFEARIPGQVEVEFVVDATGRVRLETFGIVATTHPALGEPVRRALQERRYRPAMRRGIPVSQLIQQPFAFVPDSGRVARSSP